jgi:hypothetical protein
VILSQVFFYIFVFEDGNGNGVFHTTRKKEKIYKMKREKHNSIFPDLDSRTQRQ